MLSQIALASVLLAGDLTKAPAPFPLGNTEAIFVDFESVDLTWKFDVATRTTSATAEVVFSQPKAGRAILDLIPNASAATLDGTSVSLTSISAPSNATTMRAVSVESAPGVHKLIVTYALPNVTYGSNYVRFGAFMGDLEDRGFFEQYAPTNFEYDQYRQNIFVTVSGTAKPHTIYTNGVIYPNGQFNSKVEFPAYFTTSSFYFHLVEEGRFSEQRFLYGGLEATYPVVVYAESASAVTSAVASTKRILTELESTFGIFGHDSLTVYITPSGGGMEYCGATMTSAGALGHELTHSWFARGVMPANGNSGWIDEAIASWRDESYPRRSTPGSQALLGGFSPYKRATTNAAYSSGMQFISHLDYLFRNAGGMKEVLTILWIEKRRQTITVQQFQEFVERLYGSSLQSLFDQYVYGRSEVEIVKLPNVSLHPRQYTKIELERFR